MRGLEAQDVLDVWDAGRGRNPFERSLLLLTAGDRARGREDVRALMLGDRDRLLLELRERTFGGDLASFVECPKCQGPLEFTLQAAALRSIPSGARVAERRWEGGTARLRAPTVGDLEDALRGGGTGADERLFAACVEARGEQGEVLALGELPDPARSELADQLAKLDPAAELLLSLTCPTCHHGWRQSFDVAAFFWSEIATCAKRILREVDALATAYGWDEATILRLSGARRRAYLEIVAERPVRS
jgi:hypothetical protein